MMIYLQMLNSAGDQSKFEQMYLRYRGLMFHVANRILRNEQDAEDAVHQAFLSILDHLEKISQVECPKTRSFVVIVAERKAIDLLRARRRRLEGELDETVCGWEVPLPGDGGLTNGGSRVSAYLDVDSCRGGAEPGACPLRSLSLYGENVESFCLDGKELANVDSARITELLGEPDHVEEKPNGTIYHYSMPEKGISEITFAFPNTLDTVAQIFLVF